MACHQRYIDIHKELIKVVLSDKTLSGYDTLYIPILDTGEEETFLVPFGNVTLISLWGAKPTDWTSERALFSFVRNLTPPPGVYDPVNKSGKMNKKQVLYYGFRVAGKPLSFVDSLARRRIEISFNTVRTSIDNFIKKIKNNDKMEVEDEPSPETTSTPKRRTKRPRSCKISLSPSSAPPLSSAPPPSSKAELERVIQNLKTRPTDNEKSDAHDAQTIIRLIRAIRKTPETQKKVAKIVAEEFLQEGESNNDNKKEDSKLEETVAALTRRMTKPKNGQLKPVQLETQGTFATAIVLRVVDSMRADSNENTMDVEGEAPPEITEEEKEAATAACTNAGLSYKQVHDYAVINANDMITKRRSFRKIRPQRRETKVDKYDKEVKAKINSFLHNDLHFPPDPNEKPKWIKGEWHVCRSSRGFSHEEYAMLFKSSKEVRVSIAFAPFLVLN